MITHSPRESASERAISLPPLSSTIFAPGAPRPAMTARPSAPIRATSKVGGPSGAGGSGCDSLGAPVGFAAAAAAGAGAGGAAAVEFGAAGGVIVDGDGAVGDG